MKTLLRIISILFEITVAVAIFVMLVQKTPLFERAIPGRSTSSTGTINNKTIALITAIENKNQTNNSTPTSGNTTSGNTAIGSTETKTAYIEVPVQQGLSCKTPRGETLSDGNSIIVYLRQTANQNNECQSETRTCQNGILGGSYKYQKCNYMIDGQIITPSGIKKDIITGASNEEQKFITLATFTNKLKSTPKEFIQPKPYTDTKTMTISEAKPQKMKNSTYKEKIVYKDTLDQVTNQEDHTQQKAACKAPRGDRIRNGSYVYAYNISHNTTETACLSEKRACSDGRLSGSFQYKSCMIQNTNKEPVIMSNPSQTYRGTVSSYSPYVRPIGEAIRDNILYSYSSNKSKPANTIQIVNCVTPRGQQVANGSRITAYRLPQDTNNSLCDKETRICSLGMLGGSYIYPSCGITNTTSNSNNSPDDNTETWIDRNLRSIGKDLNNIYVNSRAERNIESIGNDINDIYTNSRTERNIKSTANDVDTAYTNSWTDRNIKSTANDIDTAYTNSRADRNIKSITKNTNSVRGWVQGRFK